MSRIKLLVIGCGRIGKMHVDLLRCHFSALVEIVAIVDDKLDVAWAEQRQIPLLGKAELTTVLRNVPVDAVLVATSSSEHVSVIKQVFPFVKAIFCEKPVSFDVSTLHELHSMLTAASVQCQVGLNRRFDPDFRLLKQSFSRGKIGSACIINITNRDPKRPDLDFIPRSGGLFLDFNVHDFDMLRYITGAEIESVYAVGSALVDPVIAKFGDIDTAIINIKMSNGALALVDSSRETHYGYDQRLEVLGTDGSLRVDNHTEHKVSILSIDGLHSAKPEYSFVERYSDSYRLQFAAFFQSILANTDVEVGLMDMACAIEAATAANLSLNRAPIRLRDLQTECVA